MLDTDTHPKPEPEPKMSKTVVHPTVFFIGWMTVLLSIIGSVLFYNYTIRQNECIMSLMQYENTTAAEAKEACK